MADIEFALGGIDSLLGKLDAVSDDLKRRSGRSALRRAARLVAEAARNNARKLDDPETRQSIAANIVVRWDRRRHRRTGDLAFRVGVLGGAKQTNNYHTRRGRPSREYQVDGDSGNPGGNTFYWRFLEFGTRHIRAEGFMRRSLAENIQAATGTFLSEYEKSIDRAIKRAAKRTARSN
ncbi:HK97-gp10 family putative phage morphogenesis protein [Pseudomonas sp. TUM22785]|uniref:HK97-gp10 family putative phage morphogenesis protein n=1 Tax=Pseudomonas sp. TUM22785 TaxID=3019098 RepID=UPI002306B9C3|nr:HK97-gp10 family putative phage morphogenesis protein [Pseudomonas sp. TUM22785]WCD82994.1 HK97 gp10 family phage protein [Pseudomonas sp. TUM22785]